MVDQWNHMLIKQLLTCSISINFNFEDILKSYTRALRGCLKYRKSHRDKILAHVKFFHALHEEKCAHVEESVYLSYMEQIILIYCNLELRVLQCTKLSCLGRIKEHANALLFCIQNYCLHNQKSMFRVLLNLNIDGLKDSVRKILQLVYTHLLVYLPIEEYTVDMLYAYHLGFKLLKQMSSVKSYAAIDRITYFRLQKLMNKFSTDALYHKICSAANLKAGIKLYFKTQSLDPARSVDIADSDSDVEIINVDGLASPISVPDSPPPNAKDSDVPHPTPPQSPGPDFMIMPILVEGSLRCKNQEDITSLIPSCSSQDNVTNTKSNLGSNYESPFPGVACSNNNVYLENVIPIAANTGVQTDLLESIKTNGLQTKSLQIFFRYITADDLASTIPVPDSPPPNTKDSDVPHPTPPQSPAVVSECDGTTSSVAYDGTVLMETNGNANIASSITDVEVASGSNKGPDFMIMPILVEGSLRCKNEEDITSSIPSCSSQDNVTNTKTNLGSNYESPFPGVACSNNNVYLKNVIPIAANTGVQTDLLESIKTNGLQTESLQTHISYLSTENDSNHPLPFKKRRINNKGSGTVVPPMKEICYPATPMISIAQLQDVHLPRNRRFGTFKTAAERKWMPLLPTIYTTAPKDQFNFQDADD